MRIDQIAAGLVSAVLLLAFGLLAFGGHSVEAQDVRVEVGGGWAIPTSDIDVTGTLEGEMEIATSVDVDSGPHAYGAVGLVWTISDNFALEGRIRAQQLQLRGDAEDFSGVEQCEGGCPDGRLRTVSVEGQITLTSVGRVNPYFLVGLGAARTTLDGTEAETPFGSAQFADVDVTDAGGDVGFGATTRIVEALLLTAEIRATGSLPGSKENAITTFPFSLGLSYEF